MGQREHDRDDVHDTDVLVVRCDPDEHLLFDVLDDSYRLAAPATLIRLLDEGGG